MSAPLVSCIIPVYNGAAFLREAIESILAQSQGPLEVIVVDDGSTDATPAVAASFGDQVRYIRQANAGPAVARNRGIVEARGTFVAFLDADDLWRPDRLEKQMAPLLEDPSVSFSACMIQNFWTPELQADAAARANTRDGIPAAGYLSTGMVLRRAAFELVGNFDPLLGYGDSADWILRAQEAGLRDVLVPEVLVLRRIHGANMSLTHADESRDEFLHLLKRKLDQRRAAPPGGSVP